MTTKRYRMPLGIQSRQRVRRTVNTNRLLARAMRILTGSGRGVTDCGPRIRYHQHNSIPEDRC